MYTVSRGVTLKSSCTYASFCQAQTLGVISVEGMVKVDTLPNRKFAQDCWKVLVPVGAPELVKAKLPCWLAAFSVLLYRLREKPNARVWRPFVPVSLLNPAE